MPEKLMAIILSLGLISGIGIVSTGSASAAPKPKPIPSTVQKIILPPMSITAAQTTPQPRSIPFCRIITAMIPLAAVVILIKIPTNATSVANAVASSLSRWICP